MMKAINYVLLLIIITYLQICDSSILSKVTLTDPGALCLDGSPGAYYIHRGASPLRILIYFQGGGWCGQPEFESTLESCYQRSKGSFGSSRFFPERITMNQGIFKDNANYFGSMTKVYLKYCDGAGHQGYRAQPVNYKDTRLYFRGHNITITQLEDVQRTEGLFSRATTIIIGGQSAGGLATLLWTNYIKQKANASNIYTVSDAGIFLDAPHFTLGEHTYLQSFKALLNISNADISPPAAQCVQDHPTDPQRCMLAEELYKYITVPLFVIQSLYDGWSLKGILGIRCASQNLSLVQCSQGQMDHIEYYRRNVTKLIKQIGAHNSRNGYWAPACVFHSSSIFDYYYLSPSLRIPMHSQNSMQKSLLSWIYQTQESHHHIDQKPWPSNRPCSGVPEQKDNQIFLKYILPCLIAIILVIIIVVVVRRYRLQKQNLVEANQSIMIDKNYSNKSVSDQQLENGVGKIDQYQNRSSQ